MTACVHAPETLNVRVRNHAAHNLRVRCLTGEGAGKEELVYPGAFSRSHASQVLVHAPDASLRIVVTPERVSEGAGYKYESVTLRDLGRNEVIFEVMVDNENRTWAYTRSRERVPYPAERVTGE